MRQQQNNAILSNPLALSATDKLVNHTLGGIREVSKLGLPNHNSIGVGQCIAKFKACSK